MPMREACMHAGNRSLGMTGAEILSGDRRRRAHQADRRPRDHRKQLGVADRIRGLCGGALFERADEAQQQHAGDVHRNALHAGGQAKAKQRLMIAQSGRQSMCRENRMTQSPRNRCHKRVHADRRRTRSHVPSADPAVPERGNRPEAANQEDVEDRRSAPSSSGPAAAACAHRRPRAGPPTA